MRTAMAARSITMTALALALVVLAAGPGRAQTATPGVEVDISVIDKMGPPRPVAPEDRIVLRPPGGAKAAAAAPKPPGKPPVKAVAKPPVKPEPKAVAKPPVKPEPKAVAKAKPAFDEGPPVEPAETHQPPATGAAVRAGGTATAARPSIAPKPVAKKPAPVEAKAPEPVAKKPAPETPEVAAKATAKSSAEPGAKPAASKPGIAARLIFAPGSAALPKGAETELDPIAARLKKDATLRVQLMGYAPGSGTAARKARRLALSRALAVRLYLTQKGVGGTRALVRALGNKTEEKPIDRVDVVVVE